MDLAPKKATRVISQIMLRLLATNISNVKCLKFDLISPQQSTALVFNVHSLGNSRKTLPLPSERTLDVCDLGLSVT